MHQRPKEGQRGISRVPRLFRGDKAGLQEDAKYDGVLDHHRKLLAFLLPSV